MHNRSKYTQKFNFHSVVPLLPVDTETAIEADPSQAFVIKLSATKENLSVRSHVLGTTIAFSRPEGTGM
jgi:hypothetical protein